MAMVGSWETRFGVGTWPLGSHLIIPNGKLGEPRGGVTWDMTWCHKQHKTSQVLGWSVTPLSASTCKLNCCLKPSLEFFLPRHESKVCWKPVWLHFAWAPCLEKQKGGGQANSAVQDGSQTKMLTSVNFCSSVTFSNRISQPLPGAIFASFFLVQKKKGQPKYLARPCKIRLEDREGGL